VLLKAQVPFDPLITRVQILQHLKEKTICTYCNRVYRGNIGADELNKRGFTTVTIDGGYAAWKEHMKNAR
jgi:rhodanese-related sulfurtransferase